jgi:pimeloyl-ACP methyl ester carboxylesterase
MIKQIEGPVVLVGHSYGGAVITEAGNLPNVAALVYIAAFAPDAGEGLAQLTEQMPPAAIANAAPDSDGYLWLVQDKFHESFCQELSAEEALVMAVTQKAPLASTLGDAVTAPAWKHKPSIYQVSADDRMIHPDNQRRMAERTGARKTSELNTSHVSLASRPGPVDLIEAAVREPVRA